MNEPPFWITTGLCALLYLFSAIVAYMGCMAFKGFLDTGSRTFERTAGALLVAISLFFSTVITHIFFFAR